MAIKDIVPLWARRGLSPLMEEDSPFRSLQRQMNTLMDDWMSGFAEHPVGAGFSPRINLSEDKEKVYVRAELPGLLEKDVELSLTKNVLTIRGEKREEVEEKEGRDSYRRECTYGSFQRTIPLNVEIDEDKVDAVFKNGILNITLTKSRQAQEQSKKIPIRSTGL